MNKTQFDALVKLAKDELSSHYYDTELRFLRNGKAIELDATLLHAGDRVLVSAVPVLFAVVDNATDVQAVVEYRELINYYTFIALIPDEAGKQSQWVQFTRDEAMTTWKWWQL